MNDILKSLKHFYPDPYERIGINLLRAFVALEKPLLPNSLRCDGAYLMRSNGRSKRGTGYTYYLHTSDDHKTDKQFRIKAYNDEIAIQFANDKLTKYRAKTT